MKTSNLIIINQDNKPTTTSLIIAEQFGKQHKHVLEAIYNLEIDDDFRQPNFRPSSYINEQNKKMPMFEISKDGFMFLVMGFTGKKASTKKLQFINAFNDMFEYIQNIDKEKKDQEWIKARYDGKLKRKELTDKIQEFIDYAYLHGSKHANTYYIHITHLLNKALFGIPSLKKIDKNLRDYCDSIQLMHLTTGETIILRALTECLDNGLEYKEIYTILSKKMDSFKDLMGKGEMPSKLEEDQYKICGGKKKEIEGGTGV